MLTILQQADPGDPQRVEKAAIAGGIALLAYVISRGGIEGAIDSSRAAGVKAGTEAPLASDIITRA